MDRRDDFFPVVVMKARTPPDPGILQRSLIILVRDRQSFTAGLAMDGVGFVPL